MGAYPRGLSEIFKWRCKVEVFSLLNREPRFRESRKWSNRELQKICSILALTGKVVNVSAWRDQDKEGASYRGAYFSSASEYWITNWRSEAFGYQGGLENELYLDLENDLPDELREKFDVVFNHTTLEHIFDVQKAFTNLCAMTKDMVIVVVPFLQEQHGSYGDYWRFTPWCIKRLFERNGLLPSYISVNDGPYDSVYIFAVAAKNEANRLALSSTPGNCVNSVEKILVGQKFCDRKNWLIKLIERVINRCRRGSEAQGRMES